MSFRNKANMESKSRTCLLAMAIGIGGLLAFPDAGMAVSNASSLQCSKIRQMIRDENQIYLRDSKTGRVGRFVNNSSYCDLFRNVGYTTIKSKGNTNCRVRQCSDNPFHDHSRGKYHRHHHGRRGGRW